MPVATESESLPSDPSIDVDSWPAAIDQIRQLAKVGLPLPTAIRRASEEASRRPIKTALDDLASRIERGEPLHEAIAACGLPIAEPLRAVLETGSFTGDLWSAIGPMLATEQVARGLRRSYLRAVGYYVLCMLLAAALAVFIVNSFWSVAAVSLDDTLARPATTPVQFLMPSAVALMAVPLLAVVMVVCDFLRRLRRPTQLPLDFLPIVRGIAQRLAWYRWAATLRSLVAAEVPLSTGLKLAGKCSLRTDTEQTSRDLAETIERGTPLHEAIRAVKTPLFVRAMLEVPSESDSVSPVSETRGAGSSLAIALDEIADYAAAGIPLRVARLIQTIQVVATLIVGCGLLGYCLLVLNPLLQLFTASAAAI